MKVDDDVHVNLGDCFTNVKYIRFCNSNQLVVLLCFDEEMTLLLL